uniref:Coiled-coil domain-containing protein 6 n=1 Tax=Globodera pallida TaxID=36090 RepID=A0A183C898_GLOPA
MFPPKKVAAIHRINYTKIDMINTADELSASSSSSSSLESKDYWVKKCLDLAAAKNAAEARNEQLKQRNVELELEIRQIRESKVRMQVRVEQEEEYISNMLLKRIQKLKTDKEQLAQKYEQEEEFLINDLMRKLTQGIGERDELANRLSTDQSWVVANLLQKIRKLEAEIQNNHKSLEQLRREKVDLENSLEHEQEALFNTLGKRMDSLEAEKRRLQGRLDDLEGAGGAAVAAAAIGGANGNA